MKRHVFYFMLSSLMIAILTGCSTDATSQGQDPSSVKIELVAKPSPAQISQKINMTVQVTGLVKEEGARVEFDIQGDVTMDPPEVIKATANSNGRYTAEKTFSKSGNYTVYIHLYQDDLHITKKKQIKVL